MACVAVQTGKRFLATSLDHIDCQAQVIGSYGFGALADPGSSVSAALTGLLTIFVALFGIRLLLGYPMRGRDVVGDVLIIGIVLTLATSWPAWRTVGYDLVISGPGEIARAVGLASQLPGSSGDLPDRLQWADDALAALNGWGSGRLGVAQGDWFQLGFARTAFLVGTLGPLALVRIMAGILLAITPLVAGLMLFGITRSVFAGWAKGLAMTFLASVALTLILGVELALLEPWLQDAIAQRVADRQILDAPVEVLVVTTAFAIVSFASVGVVGWIAFHPPWISRLTSEPAVQPPHISRGRNFAGSLDTNDDGVVRAQRISSAVSETIRREERSLGPTMSGPMSGSLGEPTGRAAGLAGASYDRPEALGGSYRRTARRVSTAGQRRDVRR